MQLKRIFGTILHAKLSEFDDEVKPLSEPITLATIAIYRSVSRELLPTPSKSHYLFNTRDLAKIIQGMMQATKAYYNAKDEVLQLWCHETCRIIADRMWDAGDKVWLQKQLDEQLSGLFSTSFNALFEPFKEEVPPFVTFMRQGTDMPPYEAVRDMAALKDLLMEKLEVLRASASACMHAWGSGARAGVGIAVLQLVESGVEGAHRACTHGMSARVQDA